MEQLFITASREKLRFASSKGLLTTEDLWSLSLTSLDAIYIVLSDEKDKTSKKSLLEKKTSANTELDIKLDILKFIVETKQAEANDKLAKTVKQQEATKLKELLAKRHEDKLNELTVEELEAKLKALE